MRLNRKPVVLLVLALVLGACSSGYTQEEVDQLVADAVGGAIAEQDDKISEEEAQQQVEEGVAQASLVAAVRACEASGNSYVTVDEGGLVMEGSGNESSGVSTVIIVCILDELGIPDSILTRISNTNSTMGLVEGSWSDYNATWSYHPDNGLFIHVVVES
jgi:hypothetical protein